MANPVIQLEEQSRARLARALTGIEKLSGREAPIIVRNASRDFCRGAMRATPIAPRTRSTVWKMVRDKSGKPVPHPDGTDRALFVNVGASGRYRIRGRGFAKAGWVKAMTRLGMKMKTTYHTTGGQQAARFCDFSANLKASQPWTEIANMVPYIETLDHGGPHNPASHIKAKGLAYAIRTSEKGLVTLFYKMQKRWAR
jgi:hypothetical protein